MLSNQSIHYEKLCLQKPHYLATRAENPLKYNYVATMSSKMQLLCNYIYKYSHLINKFPN